jgi:hypothetical protein
VHALKGKTPLEKVHGRLCSPHDLCDLYMRGSTNLEQSLIDLKAPVCMHQMQRPVLDESAVVHIDPWPNVGTIHTDPNIYFEVSAMLEGEQNTILPSEDSKQAVTPKILSFLSRFLVLPTPDTLERESKPPSKEMKPKRHGAAQHPAPLKPPDCIDENPDKAGRVCLQHTLIVEMGDVEALNARMVEAKHKAKWPLQGLTIEHECGPNQSPREDRKMLHEHRPDWPPKEVPYEHRPDWPPETSYKHDPTHPSILKSTGTCKPEDKLATLISAAPGHSNVRSQHRDRGSFRRGLIDPERPYSEQKMRASSPHEKEEKIDKNQVSMVSINYGVYTPPFLFSIALEHSCSVCPHLFLARAEGCRRHCRHHWRDKASYRIDDMATGKSRITRHTSHHT